MPLSYLRESEIARDAAQRAARLILRHASTSRESWDKALDNPVTRADLEANEAICDALSAAFPSDAILSEETADRPARLRRERVWLVDPLDGTKEFIAGIPEYAVSVALVERGDPVAGCVLEPVTGECFWAARGAGAWLGERQLSVSTRTRLEESVVLSSRTELGRGRFDPYKDRFAELRPVGSVALKLAYAAACRGDLWISLAPKSEWDVCAGDLLVREAGGVFVTHEGARRYNQRDVRLTPPMAAGPRGLVEAFVGGSML
jgi:myo-inositol-1(or 4)-monophosphatase